MANSLLDSYSIEELQEIAKISNSWRDYSRKLGYNSNSSDLKNQIQKKVEENHIDVSHFKSVATNVIERSEENIFIENSTANQATLRRWYLKGNYTEYKCSICGQEPEWQGKPLTLILDHINGTNTDDRLINLRWVCPNCNMQLETTNGRNRKELSKKYYCKDCGKEVGRSTTERCAECAAKARIIPIEELPVTREQLKILIRTKPFTQIGKQFNISDNMVRKWCDKFNLPRRASDIKQYSDKEWELI